MPAEHSLVSPGNLGLFIRPKIAGADGRGRFDQRAFSWLSCQSTQEFRVDPVEWVVGFLFLQKDVDLGSDVVVLGVCCKFIRPAFYGAGVAFEDSILGGRCVADD